MAAKLSNIFIGQRPYLSEKLRFFGRRISNNLTSVLSQTYQPILFNFGTNADYCNSTHQVYSAANFESFIIGKVGHFDINIQLQIKLPFTATNGNTLQGGLIGVRGGNATVTSANQLHSTTHYIAARGSSGEDTINLEFKNFPSDGTSAFKLEIRDGQLGGGTTFYTGKLLAVEATVTITEADYIVRG